MERKIKPVAPFGAWVKNKIFKIVTFFTCVVLMFVSMCIFQSSYGCGYKYYKTEIATNKIETTQKEDLLDCIVNEYINKIEEDGYYIHSYTVDKEVLYRWGIVIREKKDINEIKQYTFDNITVFVLSTKLSIKNDDNTYYFKTEDECNKFISDLKKYNSNIETIIEGNVVDIKKITNKETLENKVEQYRLDREAKDAEEAAKRKKAIEQNNKKIVSRSDVNRVSCLNSSHGHPLDSYICISSGYGQRGSQFHTGVDFATSTGTPVHAWKAGKVVYASWCGTYGNYVRIQHNDGTESCYAHLNSYACYVGQYVNCHDIIAYSGSTGNSTGPHLHFEIKVNNQFVNPLNYL